VDVVTLRQAKAHLNLPADVSVGDADLKLKLAVAHDLVADYLKQRRDDDSGVAWAATVDAWDADTAPPRVLQAVLLQFADLYRFRGDDTDMPARGPGELAQGVTALLYRLRDPAIA
jgi:hypothetical protein